MLLPDPQLQQLPWDHHLARLRGRQNHGHNQDTRGIHLSGRRAFLGRSSPAALPKL